MSLGPPSTAGGASRQVSPLPTTPETPLYEGPSQPRWRSQSRANKHLARPGVSSVKPRAAVGGPGQAQHQCGFGGAGDGCGGLPLKKGSRWAPQPPALTVVAHGFLQLTGGAESGHSNAGFPKPLPVYFPWCSLAQVAGGQTKGPSHGHPKPGEAAEGPTHHHPPRRGPPPPPDRSPGLHGLVLNPRVGF